MPSDARSTSRVAGTVLGVAGSQIALAGSNYLTLALAARFLDPAGFAALSSFYLLINTVGRGLFAAVELESTRAVAMARAAGQDDGPARRAAIANTGLLLIVAAALLGISSPLLLVATGSGLVTIGLLLVGAVAMAASYLLRGPYAGTRRYGRYAATFWAEAGAGLAASAALALIGVADALAWIAVLALSPLVAAAALARPGEWPGAGGPVAPRTRSAVLWSAALLLAGQGLWNLAPVVVTARLTDSPAVAAGFVTVVVLLRAPVLLFPAVQAFLLPAFTAHAADGDDMAVRRATRRLLVLLIAGGIVWVPIAVLLVPPVARFVFAAPVTPPAWVLAVLALSTVLGAAAQIGQTRLVVARRPAAAAWGWIAGLAVLLGAGLLAAPPVAAAAVGQLLGTAAVLVVLSLVRNRNPARP